MNNIDLEKQIIELIPSKTMRDAIKENNHKFTDIEYTKLVLEFSTSWKNKLNLLNSIKDNTDNKNLIDYIESYVRCEMNAYNDFIKNEEEYVYDVIMDCRSENSERYLCPTYESILIVIKNYIENYKNYLEEDLGHIEIVKRKISLWDSPEEIDEPNEIVVYLNANLEIEVIYDNSDYIDPEDYDLDMNSIKYPTIYKAGDLVLIDKSKIKTHIDRDINYYYEITKEKIFGIVGFNQNQLDNDVCYFLNLSNQYVHFRSIGLNELQYVNYLDCHSHIDFGYIEKVDLNEVHPKIKDDYEYAKAKLIELGIIK